MNDYKSGNFICSLREQQGLTQAELASMLSVTPAAVSKWENGESRPRTETLFQLADILNVRAEEIIKGEYIAQNSLDEKAVDEIYKRYEYLQKVDSAQSMTVRVRRILAWLIDWLICGTPTMTAPLIFALFYQPQEAASPGELILIMLFVVLFPVAFVLRDVILSGRSLGKRCLGLIVLDRRSGERASRKQCFLLNLLFFISSIDAVILLVSGFSVGDRIADTVVTEKESELSFSEKTKEEKSDAVNAYTPPKNTKRKKLTIVSLLIAVFVILFAFSIATPFIGLNVVKTTPEYEAAYRFYVSSEAFTTLGIREEEVRLVSYNVNKNLKSGTGNAEFTFLAGGKMSDVVCHYLDGEWKACPECYSNARCEYVGRVAKPTPGSLGDANAGVHGT